MTERANRRKLILICSDDSRRLALFQIIALVERLVFLFATTAICDDSAALNERLYTEKES